MKINIMLMTTAGLAALSPIAGAGACGHGEYEKLRVPSPVPVGTPGAPGAAGPPSVPAPDVFDVKWKTDKSQVAPGESIAITFSIKNVWDGPIGFTNYPATATFSQADIEDGDAIHVGLKRDGGVPDTLEPDEELTLVANVTSDMSAGLRPGRYYGLLEVSYVTNPGEREKREAGMGFGSSILFVVTPPEGALDKTLTLKQVRETNGLALTLERIDFSPEQTIIIVLDAPLSETSGHSPSISAAGYASSTAM